MMYRAAQDDERQPNNGRNGRGLSLSKLVLVIVGSFVVGACIVLFVLLVLGRRDRLPDLTPESLEAAQRRWEAKGPKSYHLDVLLSGTQTGKIHIEVRGEKVTAMTRNGVTPEQERTWEYWTVPGQFDTIETEMEMAKDPAHGFPAPPGSKVVQKAEFDPEYGFPRRYHRLVLGTQLEIRWEVIRFEPVK
jgi:hypothetical protein